MLKKSYGVMKIKEGSILYHASDKKFKYNTNKPMLFCTFHPSEWYSKYIYPPSLDMSKGDVLNWIDDERKKFVSNPLSKDYKFDKPLFFRIVTSHNTSIYREDKWFNEAVPKLKVTWEKIKFLRENKEEALKFKEAIDSRKKAKPVFQPAAQLKTLFNKKNDGFIDSEE